MAASATTEGPTELSQWLTFEDGVVLAGRTHESFLLPNLVLVVTGFGRSPRGEGPAGFVLWQPDPDGDPEIADFVGERRRMGRRLDALFAGSEIAGSPIALGELAVARKPRRGRVRVDVFACGHEITARLDDLAPAELVSRPPSAEAPFWQQGVEARAARVRLRIDGRDTTFLPVARSPLGGPAACWSPAGVWAR
jgi:hypothetical protein